MEVSLSIEDMKRISIKHFIGFNEMIDFRMNFEKLLILDIIHKNQLEY
jgi:hypothetical protein